VPHREPMTPLIAALVSEARQLAALEKPTQLAADASSAKPVNRRVKVQAS